MCSKIRLADVMLSSYSWRRYAQNMHKPCTFLLPYVRILLIFLFSKVQEQHKNGSRIKLDVTIEAPQIVVPLKSDSEEVVVADLGCLTLSNTFYRPPPPPSPPQGGGKETSALAEKHDINLTNLEAFR